MSRWDGEGWYERATKRPPPEHGIRVKRAGTTWWGQRWIEALTEVLGADAGRLARGKSYARAGRTHDLVVEGGKVRAQVTGSRATPYEVEIALRELDAAVWREATFAMAKKAQFSAELLEGRMPTAIDEVFVAAGVSLFPRERAELETRCSCPDWGDPCKHVAATHYVLGEALDQDPFLLFELRGRTKGQVMEALRAARRALAEPSGAQSRERAGGKSEAEDVPSVALGELEREAYDALRAPLPELRFTFDTPVRPGALLRQLGAPARWDTDASPAEVFAPRVRAAAEAARSIALAEPSASSDPATLTASAATAPQPTMTVSPAAPPTSPPRASTSSMQPRRSTRARKRGKAAPRRGAR